MRLSSLLVLTSCVGLGLAGLFYSELHPTLFADWRLISIILIAAATLGVMASPAIVIPLGVLAGTCGVVGGPIGGIFDYLEVDQQERLFHLYSYRHMGELIVVGEVLGATWGLTKAITTSARVRGTENISTWQRLWAVVKQLLIFISASLTSIAALTQLSPRLHSQVASILDALIESATKLGSP